jgi:chemotaxis protein methyltransferase CheR
MGRRMTTNGFTYLQQLLLEHAGILLEAEKKYLAEARLAPVAAQEGFESIEALLDAVQAAEGSGQLERKVIEAMTNSETSFFRDLHPFEALRKFVIPEIITRRAAERTLNIWCAATASGQEPYSLAMLLREHFPQLHGWKVTLIASDISEAMLSRARAGAYSQIEINRGLPAPLLVRYFRRIDGEWQINEDLRRAIDFRRVNLTTVWPFMPAMDLVFMRNVLIYFDVPTKKAVLARVRRQLRPGGYLILGGGETTLNLDDSFAPTQFGKAICYRLVQRMAA